MCSVYEYNEIGIEVHVGRDMGKVLNVVFVSTLQRIWKVWMYTYKHVKFTNVTNVKMFSKI